MDIPKWEGPTVCDSATRTSKCTVDVKPPHSLTVKKEQRKREATALTDDGSVKEETDLVKKERAESSVEKNEEKKDVGVFSLHQPVQKETL